MSFDVKYVYNENKDVTELSKTLGENILMFYNKPEGVDGFDSKVYTSNSDYLNQIAYTANAGQIMNSGKNNWTILHESLHLLGLSDRYTQGTNEPHGGFENDIMGRLGKYSLSKVHYKNYIDYTKAVHQKLLHKHPNFETFWTRRKADVIRVDENKQDILKQP